MSKFEREIPLGDQGQAATLTEGLESESVRELIVGDAVRTYSRSLAELGCSAEDIVRNSKSLSQGGAKRAYAVAFEARAGAASLNGKSNGNGHK